MEFGLKSIAILILTASLTAGLTGCGGTVSDEAEPQIQIIQDLQEAQMPEERCDLGDEGQQEDFTEYNINLAGSFQGIYGCAVLFDPQEHRYAGYREMMGREEVSPYSTFKIISALSGLKNHVVEDETSAMNYSGVSYPISAWNKDLTLREAFQTSCVWYFRQVVDAVGEDELRKELESLEYGNGDVSEWEGSGVNGLPELNGFWLDSSLKISPAEQVQVLARIFEGQSVYGEKEIAVLKNMMLADDNGTRKIYGKTGSGQNGRAWFVGFAEENGHREYFAVYLDDENHKEQVSGEKAKEIAIDIFDSKEELAGETDDMEKYRAFVKKNDMQGITGTLLADLTGDGREELIVISSQADGGYIPIAVYGIEKNGLVVTLYEDAASDSHAGWRWLYLYEEKGKNYLFRYAPVMYQGMGTWSWEIFSLTEDGEEVLLDSAEKEVDLTGGEATEELWEQMGAFLKQVHACQEKSIPLVEIGEDYFDAEYGPCEVRTYHYVMACDELEIR